MDCDACGSKVDLLHSVPEERLPPGTGPKRVCDACWSTRYGPLTGPLPEGVTPTYSAQQIMEPHKRLTRAKERRAALVKYLAECMKDEDWHGIWDAAVDLARVDDVIVALEGL